MNPDPGGQKTYKSEGSGSEFGSRSTTVLLFIYGNPSKFLSCFNSAATTEYSWTRGPEVMKLENKKTERHWVWKIRGPKVTTTTTKIHYNKSTEEPQD